jgi:hypothetical protein
MEVPLSVWIALGKISGAGSWPPDSKESIQAFINESVVQNLFMLAAQDTSLPPRLRVALQHNEGLRALTRFRTDIMIGAMQRLGRVLEGEPFIILKGADYQFRLYDSPDLRFMADLDILVPRARRENVHQKLTEGGFVRRYPAGVVNYLESHHETVFSVGGVVLDVHHGFIQRQRNRIDYEAIWSRRVPAQFPGFSAFRLDDGDAVLHHALGIAIKEFNVPISRYLDLYLLIDRFNGDLAELVTRAREWRIERALYAALRRMIDVFPEVEPRIGPTLPTLLSPRVRQHLDQIIPLPGTDRSRLTRREQLRRKWHLMDGYQERVGFLVCHYMALTRGIVLKASRAGIKVTRHDADVNSDVGSTTDEVTPGCP